MAAPPRAASEFQVKAAFIHNFTRFIEWPSSTRRETIVLGLIGQDPFGGSLDDQLRGKTGHVAIRRLRWTDSTAGCNAVYISTSELPHLAQILESLRGSSVLTIGDFDRFVARGGMIQLRVVEGKVRFDINRAATEAAHLKVSAKLLELAETVTQ